MESAYQSSSRINKFKSMPTHITVKLQQNVENKVLKPPQRKDSNSKGTQNRFTEYSAATKINARREGDNTFKMLRENNLQPRILFIHAAKLPLKRKGNTFTIQRTWMKKNY